MTGTSAARHRPLVLATVVVLTQSLVAQAGPINTNVALTPNEGGSIFRLQYVFGEADGRGVVEQAHTFTLQGTYVYGLRSNVALFFTLPYVHREVDRQLPRIGRVEDAHDGVADPTFLVKWRLWQRDPAPLETMRWALLGGLNVRSGDSDFSSDSYDPIFGTVFSWRRGRSRFDADAIYRFNTGGGERGHDVLRYDIAYSHRVYPTVYRADDAVEFDVVLELNGSYTADGSHEIFLSPGIQYITEKWVAEASVQLPVVQELDDAALETEYRVILGFRFQW